MSATNPRLDKPSCSEFSRLASCPGSRRQIRKTHPDHYAIEDEADSQRGTAIHDYLSGKPAKLPKDWKAVADECIDRERYIVEALGFADQCEVIREERIYGPSLMWSGQLDAIYIDGTRGLVVDYKTGWGDLPPPASNLQLRGYAVLAAKKYKLTEVSVAIVNPNMRMEQPATYDVADLERAKVEIWKLVKAAEGEDAPLNAGPHCKFCPAAAGCPALREVATTTQTLEERFESMPLEERHWTELIPALKRFIAVAEKRIRADVEAGDPDGRFPNLRIGKGRKTYEIDTAKAWEEFSNLGSEAFIAACKVGKTALEEAFVEAVRSADPAVKVKDAKAEFNTRLAKVGEVKMTRGSLEVVK